MSDIDETQFDYDDFVTQQQEELKELLKVYPFNQRRYDLMWKQILDKDKKLLKQAKKHRICNMDTEHLHNILLDTDYDNSTNYDITLRTIWEEYHNRKNHTISQL